MTVISVIICTLDRRQILVRALDSVAAASERLAALDASVEIILVDNSSHHGTVAVSEQWAVSAKVPVTIVREPRRGLAIARNAGIRNASGDILVFTDDDCQLASDYLEKTLAHYAKDQQPVIRCGRVELGDPTDLPFTIKTDTKDAVLTSIYDRDTFIAGCNMTMRRDVVQIIGGFDERFGAGTPFRASEETDFIYRAYSTGIRIEYRANMLIYHWHGRKGIEELNTLQQGYCIGLGALRMKHGKYDLVRFSYYDLRGMVREMFGGRRPYSQFGFTYRSAVWWIMVGMMRYLAQIARQDDRTKNGEFTTMERRQR